MTTSRTSSEDIEDAPPPMEILSGDFTDTSASESNNMDENFHGIPPEKIIRTGKIEWIEWVSSSQFNWLFAFYLGICLYVHLMQSIPKSQNHQFQANVWRHTPRRALSQPWHVETRYSLFLFPPNISRTLSRWKNQVGTIYWQKSTHSISGTAMSTEGGSVKRV